MDTDVISSCRSKINFLLGREVCEHEVVDPTITVLEYLRNNTSRMGASEVRIKKLEGVEVLASLPAEQGGHPLLVTGTYGKGRTLAWTSGIRPALVAGRLLRMAGLRHSLAQHRWVVEQKLSDMHTLPHSIKTVQ